MSLKQKPHGPIDNRVRRGDFDPLTRIQCEAHTKASKGTVQCKHMAILGGNVCVNHGARAGQVKAAAERRVLVAEVLAKSAFLGDPRAIDSKAALEEELYRTAGYIEWLSLMVAAEMPVKALGLDVLGTYELCKRERQHFFDLAKVCEQLGIATRLVEIEEQHSQLIADVIRRALDDPELGLSVEQQRAARVVAARHLRLVAAGETA